jgi:hypothetical protein
MHFPDNRTMEVNTAKISFSTLISILTEHYGETVIKEQMDSLLHRYESYSFLYFRRNSLYMGVNDITMCNSTPERYFDGTSQFNISRTAQLLQKVNICSMQS